MAGSGVLTGRQLAEYQLRRLLGEDSFGQVYEAFHVSLRRDLALRVLSERFTFAAGFEARFAHMGRVLAVLEHPNLLGLDDYGQDGPYAYLVTPLVEASTLEEWLRAHPQEPVIPAQLMRIIGQLTSVLSYLHKAGVTHLGITPSRVLLEPNGHLLLSSPGLPYLAEQLWRGWNEPRARGNPVFLAPEQLSGSAPSGPACDIYAVGAILYRLLGNAPPFDPNSPTILEDKFKPPPSLRSQKQAPPPELEEIALRALHPAPEQRWPSISDIAEAFYTVMQRAGYDRAAGLAPGSASRYISRQDAAGAGPSEGQGKGAKKRSGKSTGLTEPYLLTPDAPPEAIPPRAWSVVNGAPAANGGPDAAARPRRSPLTRVRFVVFTTIKILILPLIIGVLGYVILLGYIRWRQLQTPLPTPVPSVTPKPKHGSLFPDEAAQLYLLAFPAQKASSSS
ncbi:MAG TPA: serine/threonine-protein kinase [Ktedonobacterales bacterium]|jgi:serine/threonine protein kinase